MTNKTAQKKRTGFLYRRLKGKDYSIDDPEAKDATIWLQYRLNRKLIRVSLKTSKLKEAEYKRSTIMDPLRSADAAEATAQLVLRASQAKEEHEALIRSQNPPLCIADAWNAYLSSHARPDSGEATLQNYQLQWKRFITWVGKEYPQAYFLNEVTPSIASEYASDLTKAGFTANTYNKHTNLVRLVFETLREPAQIGINPFEKIIRKKLKTDSKRALTKQELKVVLDSANGDLKILLYIGTFTGLRLGDCATLKWEEVDLNKLLIRRRPRKTKSANSKPVTVGIPPTLWSIINSIPNHKRIGYVLPAIADKYLRDKTGLAKIIQKHFESCGIQTHREGTGKTPEYKAALKKWIAAKKKGPKPTYKRAVVEVGFHSLRHTFVSRHAEQGTPQAVIQMIVGHGNPAMTEHYTHIGDDTFRRVAGALESGIKDADFEEIDPPVPKWVIDKLKNQAAETWEAIRDELVKKSRSLSQFK